MEKQKEETNGGGKVIQMIAKDIVDNQNEQEVTKSDQEHQEEDMLVAKGIADVKVAVDREDGKTISAEVVNTETIEERKQRTIIVLCENANLVSQVVEEVGKKNNAFVVIGDQEIFDEFFAKYVSSSIEPNISSAIDDYLNNPEKIALARELAMTIGTAMGFDKEFRVQKLTNMFPWKLDDAKEKMHALVEFGFAKATPNGNGQFFTVSLDAEKRKQELIANISQYLEYVEKQAEELKNILDADQKKALKRELQAFIGNSFGLDVENFNVIIDKVNKVMKEKDCTFLQAMIAIEQEDNEEGKGGGEPVDGITSDKKLETEGTVN